MAAGRAPIMYWEEKTYHKSRLFVVWINRCATRRLRLGWEGSVASQVEGVVWCGVCGLPAGPRPTKAMLPRTHGTRALCESQFHLMLRVKVVHYGLCQIL